MGKRVVITGIGCISPVGNDVSTMWSNLLAGKSGVGLITHYDTSRFDVKIAAEVKDFDGVAFLAAGKLAAWIDLCSSPWLPRYKQ